MAAFPRGPAPTRSCPSRRAVPPPSGARARVGIAAHPGGAWTTQAARNFLMDRGHRATPVKFLIRDRAGQFTGASDAVSTANGTRIPASPPQAPRANATCERIIGTLRWELSGQLLIVNEHHLRRVLTEYLQHYNTAWPHRALGQLAPGHPRSTSPGTASAENKSSARLRASIRSPHDSPSRNEKTHVTGPITYSSPTGSRRATQRPWSARCGPAPPCTGEMSRRRARNSPVLSGCGLC